MQKLKIGILLLVLSFLSFGSFAPALAVETAQTGESENAGFIPQITLPQVAVTSVVVDRSEYASGDTIQGTFVVTNASDAAVNTVNYTVALTEFTDDNVSSLNLQPQQGVVDEILSPYESITISFSYVVPQAVPPIDLAIKVTTSQESGFILGWDQSSALKVTGAVEPIPVLGLAVKTSDGEVYSAGQGPTIYRDIEPKGAFLAFDIANNSSYDRTVTPKITIREKNNPGAVVYEQMGSAESIIAKERKPVEIAVPNFDYAAGVYFVSLQFFDDKQVPVSEVSQFQYIVAGKIVTVLDVFADKQVVDDGDTINVSLEYTGAPFDIGDLSRQVSANQEATVNIVLYNEKNKEVGTFTGTHSFTNTKTTATFPVEITKDARALRAVATVSDGDRILSTKESILTANFEEIQGEQKSLAFLYVIFTLTGLILIAVAVYIYRLNVNGAGKIDRSNVIATIAALLLIATGLILSNAGPAGAVNNVAVAFPPTTSGVSRTIALASGNCPAAEGMASISLANPVHQQTLEAGKPVTARGIKSWLACRNTTSRTATSLFVARHSGIPDPANPNISTLSSSVMTRTHTNSAFDAFDIRINAGGPHSWINAVEGGREFSQSVPGTAFETPGYYLMQVNFSADADGFCKYEAYKRVWLRVVPATPSVPVEAAPSDCNGNVTLSWAASAGATSYNVYRSAQPDSANGEYVLIGTTANTTYTDMPGTARHYYRISGVYTALQLESQQSAPVRAQDLPDLCTGEISCSVTPSTGTLASTYRWSATFSGETEELPTYTWTGDEGLSATTQNVEKQYSVPGIKFGTVTVEADGISRSYTCPVSVNVEESQLGVTCGANVPTFVSTGVYQTTWESEVTGATGPVTYEWSGTDGLTGNTPTVTKNYSEVGVKTADLTVSSGGKSVTTQCFADIMLDDPVCGSASGAAQINAPTSNLCQFSEPSDIVTDSVAHQWSCTAGYASQVCTAPRCANGNSVVNGSCIQSPPPTTSAVCGSANGVTSYDAPTTGLCSVSGGTASSVSTDANAHNWSCLSTSQSNMVMCSAPRPFCPPGQIRCGNSCTTASSCKQPVCGIADGTTVSSTPTSGLCSLGAVSSSGVQSNSTSYQWTCEFPGSTSASCSAQKWCNGGRCAPPPSTSAECGVADGISTVDAPASGLCAAGTAATPTYDSQSNTYTWSCVSSTGSSVTMCSAPRVCYVGQRLVNGVCTACTNCGGDNNDGGDGGDDDGGDDGDDTGKIIIDTFEFDPGIVSRSTDLCLGAWSLLPVQPGAPAITCRLKGPNNLNSLVNGTFNVGPGEYSLTCTDGTLVDTQTRKCQLLPNFDEF